MMLNQKILDYYNSKKVLITGGSGLIGRQIVKVLCDAEAEVTIVSLDKIDADVRAKQVYGDLTKLDLCKDIINGYDAVFHLAGVKASVDISKKMLASHFVPNLMLSTNILEACRVNNIARVVYTSSIGAYSDADVFIENDQINSFNGAPLDFASWAKRMGELQIYAYGVQYNIKEYSIVRLSAVYGPGDNFDPKSAMMVPSLLNKIYSGNGPIEIWGDGTAIRDIAFSKDVAEGIILAQYHTTSGGYINLGSGKGHSVREIVETLNSFIDFEYYFDTSKPTGASKKLLDITKARSLLKYDPKTSLKDGLKETWEWFLSNTNEHKLKQNYFNSLVTT